MLEFPAYLWPPQRRGLLETIGLLDEGLDVCLYAPTGGGKTEQAIQLCKWAAWKGVGACFYLNRRLLIPQTADRFAKAGLRYGIRAADYEDCYDLNAPFQVCSADTEASRVYERGTWNLHEAGLIIIDEAHLQRTKAMAKIRRDYKKRGARAVLLTATPIGLSKWADKLVISGKLAEYRDCKAIVPAMVKSIQQPDLSKVKRNRTGEYIWEGKRRAIYTQSIVGNVIDRWKRYNPDARPTLLYAPGKPESVWFTEQFQKIGINWCHVDATDAVVDTKRRKLTRPVWQEIQERYREGDIKGLSSRFKLREGIDLPFVFHVILATPIGSLASSIQTCGRALRYSKETPDYVLITDHGGVYHHHGSINRDKPWAQWWNLPEHVVSTWHQNQIREGKGKEPIRCPQCEGERIGGITCPHCGFTHEKSQRRVIQENGELVEKEGELIRRKLVRLKPGTADQWARMFWGFRNSKKARNRTFAQMEAFFLRENHYYPPRTLPYMPIQPEDWFRKVGDVPLDALRGRESCTAKSG